MDQKTYDFAQIVKWNDDHSAPGIEIYVGGKRLDGIFCFSFLEVEQSADGTAGGCSFVIDGLYDYEHSNWLNRAMELIRPGAVLEIWMGYARKALSMVFFGYIDDCTIEFGEDASPRLLVSGLDGLGYLMNIREEKNYKSGEAIPIAEQILKKSVSAGVAKKVTVCENIIDNKPFEKPTIRPSSVFEAPIRKEKVDDWKFLNLLAQRCGLTLFALNGEMIFDDVMSRTRPIMTMTLGKGLLSFRKQVSLAHQVGKVEIWGRDVNQKPITGSASNVSVGGPGKTAVQLFPQLSEAVLREYNEFVRTEDECKELAQRRLDGIAMGLVSGGGTCVGIPMLIPGRYVRIEGMDPGSNDTYFITKVRHLIDENGYRTFFEIRGARA